MNREQAKGVVKHADLIKAYADGRTIQWKNEAGLWINCVDPWFCAGEEYRVKPEPRRFWRVEFEDGRVWTSNHLTEEAAKDCVLRANNGRLLPVPLRVVEYIEVVK